MTIEAWILLMNLKVTTFCNSLFVPVPTCQEYIMDCVTDGESLKWCQDDFMKSYQGEK